MAGKCLLIGLDGGTFRLLDPLMEQGIMPFLKSFVGSGVRADLVSCIPPLTPPAWTSIMTGRNPGSHGILNFVQFENAKSRYMKIPNSRDNRCETLWSIASRQGKRVGTLNFPLMYPPAPIDGYLIPGWAPRRWIKRYSIPDGIHEILKKGASIDIRDLAVDLFAEAQAVVGCRPEELADRINQHKTRFDHWAGTTQFLFTGDPTDLTAVVFDETDRIQHLGWRFLDGGYSDQIEDPDELRIRDLCLDFYRSLDRVLESLMEKAGPESYCIIVSDHGFGPTKELFYINTWLEKQGYLAWIPDMAREKSADELQIPKPNDLVDKIDWTRTTAFAGSIMSNGIYIPVAGERGPFGINREDYGKARSKLTGLLLENCRHPVTGGPIIKKVVTREEAYQGPCSQNAPDLTFELFDECFSVITPSDEIVLKRKEVQGTHRPEGIFMATGPGIRKNVTIEPLRVIDVAPAVLYCLDLPVPEDLEGRMPQEIFEPHWLSSRPVVKGEATRAPHWAARRELERTSPETEDSEAIMKQLRNIGYFD